MSYVLYVVNIGKIRFEKHIQLFDSKLTYEVCYKSYLIRTLSKLLFFG